MKTIMTVQGPVCPEELGFCQCHEHLAISKGTSWEKSPVLLIDDLEKSTQEAARLMKSGGGTVVDAQPGGCNRIEKNLLAISKKTGLNIVASTGFHKLCFYPEGHWLFTLSEDELRGIFIHELTAGMFSNIDTEFHSDCSSIRAGIVKMALDTEGLTPIYRKLFAAGAEAARAADVPVMVHIEQGSDPIALFHFLKERRVPPKRMIFCHMDRAIPDLEIHKQLLAEGIFLEYDTIGRFKYHSDLREIEIFQTMLSEGFGDQLLFSLDTTRARLKSYEEQAIGLDYLFTSFLPLMRHCGIAEGQIEKISHSNFVRVFTDDPV
ncbi:MAG: hypothetical protein Q4C61_08480 [Lachnospiraceae bacterium]|nr:hypothetical protein [Lachnospiraceae bacterium]